MTTRRDFLAASASSLALAWPLRPVFPYTKESKPMHDHDGRHDFDFFHGRWQVHNRRLRQRHAGSEQWDEFPATLDCRPLLGGLGNIDEYRSADVHGLTLRLFDPQQRQWSDRWASARDGQLGLPAHGRFVDGVGRFIGEDRDGGRRILSRALWSNISAGSFTWEQAASLDDGATWETNWRMWFRRLDAAGRLLHDDAVVELRQYTLQPDQRDTLIELFEREFIEPQEAVGMHIIGHFRDLDAPDRFVWLRGFPSMEARREALQAFYFGPVWQRHRDAANATMIDSDDVLLLKPLQADAGLPESKSPRPAPGTNAAASALCVGICTLNAPAEQGFATRFDRELAPLLQRHGAQVVARYVTEASANTFPRLPVREDERVFVWLAHFDGIAALDVHLAALRGDAVWREALATTLLEELKQPPELLRLAPTARSELR